jgi:translocation and assembly module TamB
VNRRLRLAAALALFVLFAAPGGFVIFLTTTSGVQWMRQLILRQVEQRTGTHLEMDSFRFNLWRLRFEIAGLTVHGLEPPGYPPLFRANRLELGLRVISFFHRQVALQDLLLDRPEIFVRFDGKGHSNLPPQRQGSSNRPWRDNLFSLRIGHLELRDGAAIWNDYRVPLSLAGNNLNFDLRYFASADPASSSYVGALQWQQVQFTEKRNAPFSFDLSSKFTLHRNAFELDDLSVKLPHSEFGLRAELASFAHPDWDLHYRGKLSLVDVRTIFRAPTTPDAIADFSGQAHYAAKTSGPGEWTASGHYNGHDIRMTYRYFHASGFQSWGDYQIANGVLKVPNLNVRALDGSLDGHLEMAFHGLVFHTETHMHRASLAATLAAVNDRENLPVNALHWTGSMDVDAVNTWESNFKKFRTVGETRWASAPETPQTIADSSGLARIPTMADVHFDYDDLRGVVSLAHGYISTPRMQLNMDGFLGKKDSALEVQFRADDLLDWDEFIDSIRGPESPKNRITGSATWNGRVLGPLVGPTFSGHVHSNDIRYDKLYWQEIDGDMEYSPDGFTLKKASVRRSNTSAALDLSLHFDGDWNFTQASPWTLTLDLQHASSDDLQAMLDTNYPVTGLLTGKVQAGGTRGAPYVDSDFRFDQIRAANVQLDRLTGQLHVDPAQIRLSRAELLKGTGNVSGDVLYQLKTQDVSFDLEGSNIALEGIPQLSNSSLPPSGRLDFNLRGSGPLRAPIAQANVKVENLKFGTEIQGNFRGDITSDGHSALMVVSSELARGRLQGRITLGYGGDEPISGQLTLSQVDLDPMIVSAAHLKQLTGHSSADGVFNITGSLRQPESIEVDANITRITFAYEFVQLTNDQPVQLAYRRNEIRIGQAHIHGTDTDLQLSGNARFDRDRAMRFTLAGGINLRLLRGFLPDLQAQGRADANVSVEGTMSQPRITGRATVRDASASYADFPIGLSKVNGDMLFDKNRLVFDRMTAESGGGQLALSGSLNYGEGPLRYEISAATPNVRIRYPAGMSWLAGGNLQLSGTQNAAILSGRVQVQRLLFAEGVDLASFFASSAEPSADVATTSTFLQNLTFDIEGQTNPGARIEWTGAQIEMDGNVRLRGTWSRPVLLGHIHLIEGQMPFRGNTYQLTRGEINFANPFRLDPILNVEATSTISQYQVTIDFSGAASRLTMNYRSDPPLPDSDIIALLALGTPGESSALRSASASQNYGATALLSEAISSGLGGRIEKLFGISQFRVDPFVAGTATESNAAARITIEQQVKNKLTITYSTNAATSNQYQLIQVEYAVKRDLSVLFLRDINGTNGFDIKWVKHFK